MLGLLVLAACLSQPATQPGQTYVQPPSQSTQTGAAELEHSISVLVEQLVAWFPQERKPKVAVLDLESLSGTTTDFDRFVAEELTTKLFATRRVAVVERALLRRVLDELRLQMSATVDPATAAKLGQLTGAQFVISGHTTDLGSEIRISVRALDTTTGAVAATGISTISKGAVTMTLLGQRTQSAQASQLETTGLSRPDRRQYAFYEDFSRLGIGSAPTGWLGTEHYGVQQGARGANQFACFEPGPAKFTLTGTPLQSDFRVDIVIMNAGQSELSTFRFEAGNIRFGANLKTYPFARSEHDIYVNNAHQVIPAIGSNTWATFSLERRADVLTVFVDGKSIVFGRYPGISIPATWTFAFWPNESINCDWSSKPVLKLIAVRG